MERREAWGRNPGLESRRLLAGSAQARRPSLSAMEGLAGASEEGLGCYKYSSYRLSLAGTSLDNIEGKGRRKLFKMVVTMTFNLLDVSWLVELFTGDLRSGKSPDAPGAPAWAPGEASLRAGGGTQAVAGTQPRLVIQRHGQGQASVPPAQPVLPFLGQLGLPTPLGDSRPSGHAFTHF